MRQTPPGFSSVHYARIAGNVPQFCVRTNVRDHRMQARAYPEGVTVSTDECVFEALVEFHAPPNARPRSEQDLQSPRNWRIGFVQTLTDGAIVYVYEGDRVRSVRAAIGPERVPCRDSDGQGPFFDNGLALSPELGTQFDEELWLGPADVVPFVRTSPNLKYAMMGDAPGSATSPSALRLRCAAAGDRRAVMGKQYRLGWTDPLDPTQDAHTARLCHIEGRLGFKTWLAMMSKGTGTMYYLYEFRWEARFAVRTDARRQTAVIEGPGGSRLVSEGAVYPDLSDPVVGGPTANDSACIKFLRA